MKLEESCLGVLCCSWVWWAKNLRIYSVIGRASGMSKKKTEEVELEPETLQCPQTTSKCTND